MPSRLALKWRFRNVEFTITITMNKSLNSMVRKRTTDRTELAKVVKTRSRYIIDVRRHSKLLIQYNPQVPDSIRERNVREELAQRGKINLS